MYGNYTQVNSIQRFASQYSWGRSFLFPVNDLPILKTGACSGVYVTLFPLPLKGLETLKLISTFSLKTPNIGLYLMLVVKL